MAYLQEVILLTAVLAFSHATMSQADKPPSTSGSPSQASSEEGAPCMFAPDRGDVPSCIRRGRDGSLFVASNYLREIKFDSTGLAPLWSEGEPNGWVYINRAGKVLVTGVPGFDNWADAFQGGLVRTVKNGKFGFANRRGEIVIPQIYDWASHFRGGTALVCNGCRPEPCSRDCEHRQMIGGTWFRIDRHGKTLPAPAESNQRTLAIPPHH